MNQPKIKVVVAAGDRKAYQRAYQRIWMREHRASLPKGRRGLGRRVEAQHGTLLCYQKRGCRCPLCREANAVRRRHQRRAQKRQALNSLYLGRVVP